MRGVLVLPLIGFVAFLSGCGEIEYGLQAANGHLALLNERQPIEQALVDPGTPEAVKRQLRLSQEVLVFAGDRGLTIGQNYRHYSETDPRAVVYNVFATPEFDLSPLENCFPVIGCVAYRGFYAREDAEAHQAELDAKGLDTALFPIGAYSTLGYTPDPLTTAIIARGPNALVRTLIHESVHATLFLGGDTAFDEGMAEAIAEELSFIFWQTRGQSDDVAALDLDLDEVHELDAQAEKSSRIISEASTSMKGALMEVFENEALSDTQRVRDKKALYDQFRQWRTSNLEQLRPYTYGALFPDDMNNAHLLAFSLYDDLKLQLRTLFAFGFDRDVSAFIGWARSTQNMTPTERRAAMDQELAKIQF